MAVILRTMSASQGQAAAVRRGLARPLIVWKGPPNLVANPNAEYDVAGAAPAGWAVTSAFGTSAGYTLIATAAWAHVGTKSIQFGCTSIAAGDYVGLISSARPAVAAGEAFSLAAWVNTISIAAGVYYELEVNFFTAAGAYLTTLASPAFVTTGTPKQIVYQGIVPASAASAAPIVAVYNYSGAAGSAGSFQVDAIQFHRSATLPSYADGDSAGWEWIGTPGNSISQPAGALAAMGAQQVARRVSAAEVSTPAVGRALARVVAPASQPSSGVRRATVAVSRSASQASSALLAVTVARVVLAAAAQSAGVDTPAVAATQLVGQGQWARFVATLARAQSAAGSSSPAPVRGVAVRVPAMVQGSGAGMVGTVRKVPVGLAHSAARQGIVALARGLAVSLVHVPGVRAQLTGARAAALLSAVQAVRRVAARRSGAVGHSAVMTRVRALRRTLATSQAAAAARQAAVLRLVVVGQAQSALRVLLVAQRLTAGQGSGAVLRAVPAEVRAAAGAGVAAAVGVQAGVFAAAVGQAATVVQASARAVPVAGVSVPRMLATVARAPAVAASSTAVPRRGVLRQLKPKVIGTPARAAAVRRTVQVGQGSSGIRLRALEYGIVITVSQPQAPAMSLGVGAGRQAAAVSSAGAASGVSRAATAGVGGQAGVSVAVAASPGAVGASRAVRGVRVVRRLALSQAAGAVALRVLLVAQVAGQASITVVASRPPLVLTVAQPSSVLLAAPIFAIVRIVLAGSPGVRRQLTRSSSSAARLVALARLLLARSSGAAGSSGAVVVVRLAAVPAASSSSSVTVSLRDVRASVVQASQSSIAWFAPAFARGPAAAAGSAATVALGVAAGRSSSVTAAVAATFVLPRERVAVLSAVAWQGTVRVIPGAITIGVVETDGIAGVLAAGGGY